MRAADLNLGELLQYEPNGGVIRFGSQRVLLLDSVALGILRRELIETLGVSAARGLLTRFGYAHGWRTAESLRSAFPWDDESEWRRAGGRLHALQGLVVVEPTAKDGRDAEHLADAVWHDSYEAEQHLLHFGQSEDAVCWTLTGFAGGYLSFCNHREVICVEERCRGKGDAVCHITGRFREDWDESIDEQLHFYQKECLDSALAQVAEQLKKVELKLRKRKNELKPQGRASDAFGIVAQSEAMQRVVELALRVAQVDSTVLITGESGAGKERIARLIHDESTRSQGPFIAINCGAVPESLLESELFGHAKGSFTGASQHRPGLFEAANGGTLLLDEVGEVPPAMQVKLLRTLQEREVRRVGENTNRAVNVRVIAATNRDLAVEINAARFRQDLYYRLRVVELRVPALRERRDDILPLARAFLGEAGVRVGRTLTGLTPRAANQLVRYGWPGNVRELENAIERAAVLARGNRIDTDDLPDEVAHTLPSARTVGTVLPLEQVERDYILSVVAANDGNRAATAEQLKIGIATLYRKLKQYEVDGT
jgi:two-component system, NtrC family, response regulator HydG